MSGSLFELFLWQSGGFVQIIIQNYYRYFLHFGIFFYGFTKVL